MGAKVSALVHSMNVGELSVAGMARVDNERTRLGAEVQENVLPHTVGKGQIRPGAKYVATTRSNAKARFLPFTKSVSDSALLELTDSNLRVIVSDAPVTRATFSSSIQNSSFSGESATVTISIASPAVITFPSNHGMSAGDKIAFSTDHTLPTGITAGTTYYVLSTSLTTTTMRISTSSGGSAVNTSGTQSGTHTAYSGWAVTSAGGGSVAMTGGNMVMNSGSRGGNAVAKQIVTTSSAGTEHAIAIEITRGPVLFRCGSSDGAEDYINESLLRPGIHSLAFTPTASPYYIQFTTREYRDSVIASCATETSASVMTLSAPWTEAQLPSISYDQSGDIVFLAYDGWQQRMIERRGTNSWSLVKYETDDGPFAGNDTNGIKLTIGATHGNTTLTASSPIFRSTDVGSLIRISNIDIRRTNRISGDNEWSDPVRVFGVGNDNDFRLTRGGTWATAPNSGTLYQQRSYDSEDSGFLNVASGTYSANGTVAITVGVSRDNVEHWYRFGFGRDTNDVAGYGGGYADITIDGKGAGDFGIVRVTAFTSSTSVSVEVLKTPSSLTPTDDWEFGAWSDRYGWPSAVRFYDGRLWWGGEDKFWGSESDNFYAFNLETEGDSGSIQRNVATGGAIATVEWFLPLQRLIIGTQSAEVSVRSSSFDEPLTPTNITLKDASTVGSGVYTPAKIDSRGIFIESGNTRLYEIIYNVDSNDYISKDITRLNEDIGSDGFVELAVQRKPEPYIWSVKSGGEVAVLLYNPAEEVAGFCRFIAAPSAAGAAVIESVCVLPSTGEESVYLAVKRTINGSTVRYIEKLAKRTEAVGGTTNRMCDSYVYTAGPVTTVTGLTHLIGETVIAWGTTGGVTGRIGTTYTVNGSGQITLPSSSTDVVVGLKYTWRYKSAKLAYGVEGATAILKHKRVPEIGLLLADTHPDAIAFGPTFDATYPMTRRGQTGSPISTSTFYDTYDEMIFPMGGTWDTDSRVCLKGEAPFPATILGIVMNVETNV